MESKSHYRDSLCVRHGQEYFFFIIQMFQPMRNMTGTLGNVIRDANSRRDKCRGERDAQLLPSRANRAELLLNLDVEPRRMADPVSKVHATQLLQTPLAP
jgi:hypothetical protein